MKIVNIIGGLGNQMFQFALYLALRNRFPSEEIKIFTGAYKGYSKHNAYELDRVFGLSAPEATKADMRRLAYPYLNYRMWQIGFHLLPQRSTMLNEKIFGHYYPEAFDKADCYYDGYWQNERYFADIRQEILMAYTPISIDQRNASVARKLTTCNSVSIHVRHGDFLDKKIYRGICDIDYYRNAIERVLKETDVEQFCIFSNDMEWCKDSIVPLLHGKEYILADWNTGADSYLDMYLMSQCRHNIIAHSSFSWWGAWLNQYPQKIVIGPRKWVNIKNSEFQLNPSWIKI